jgi:aspartyl protease family protein
MYKLLLAAILLGLGAGWMLPTGEAPAPSAAVLTVPEAGRPSPAADAGSAGPVETLLERSGNGHFYVHGEVNAQLVRFVVDTGATAVALTVEDARRLGIPFSPADFTVIGTGASGAVRGKPMTFNTVSVEGKEVRDVRGAVVEGLDVSLLGQTYLSRIGGVEMSGDSMRLR